MAVILNLVDPPLDREHVTSEGDQGLQVRCRAAQRLYAAKFDALSQDALALEPPRKWHKIPEDTPIEASTPRYVYRNGVVFPVALVYLEVKLLRGNRDEGRSDELQQCYGFIVQGPSVGVPPDAPKPRAHSPRARKPKGSGAGPQPAEAGTGEAPHDSSQGSEAGAPDHEDTLLGL